MINYLQRMNKKAFLALLVLFTSAIIFCQPYSGRIIISDTDMGVGFANIGIVGKNIGTVSDIDGNFTLDLGDDYDFDSLKFSMIGYESLWLLVKDLKESPTKKVYLSPKSYKLTEVKVTYHKYRKQRLGNPVTTHDLRSGFADNELGSELGVKVHVRQKAVLENINLNVGTCTYDSVTYRLNIYRVLSKSLYENILTEPIYISFSKNQIENVIVFNLRKYSITVEGDILVTLELYKDLGEGRLLFNTEFFTGITYHKKVSQGLWTQAAGVIGLYLNSFIITN